MTMRQLLEKLSARPGTPMKVKLMLSSGRLALDAWKPGLLDKHVGLKISPEQRLITLAVEGSKPYTLTFDELEACIENPGNGKSSADRGGDPLVALDVGCEKPV